MQSSINCAVDHLAIAVAGFACYVATEPREIEPKVEAQTVPTNLFSTRHLSHVPLNLATCASFHHSFIYMHEKFNENFRRVLKSESERGLELATATSIVTPLPN